MDGTAVVGVAGIAGTLLGAVVGPVIAEKMRRTSARDDRLLDRRLDVYADILRAATTFVDNAVFWASLPLADLPQTDQVELDKVVGRIRVVGSDEVKARVTELMSCASEFYRLLVMDVRPHHERLRDDGKVDDADASRQRMALADIATRAREVFHKLEAAARADCR